MFWDNEQEDVNFALGIVSLTTVIVRDGSVLENASISTCVGGLF